VLLKCKTSAFRQLIGWNRLGLCQRESIFFAICSKGQVLGCAEPDYEKDQPYFEHGAQRRNRCRAGFALPAMAPAAPLDPTNASETPPIAISSPKHKKDPLRWGRVSGGRAGAGARVDRRRVALPHDRRIRPLRIEAGLQTAHIRSVRLGKSACPHRGREYCAPARSRRIPASPGREGQYRGERSAQPEGHWDRHVPLEPRDHPARAGYRASHARRRCPPRCSTRRGLHAAARTGIWRTSVAILSGHGGRCTVKVLPIPVPSLAT